MGEGGGALSLRRRSLLSLKKIAADAVVESALFSPTSQLSENEKCPEGFWEKNGAGQGFLQVWDVVIRQMT